MRKGDKELYIGSYVIAGDVSALPALISKLEKDGLVLHASPDVYARAYRKFGVEEAEEIRMRARTRPIRDERKVFALFVPSMTTESQNALLKTIEEPAADALFFIITPSPQMLLATLLSRMQSMHVEHARADYGESQVDARSFLTADTDDRLAMLKPLYDHDEDEGRDIGAVLGFLQACERLYATMPVTHSRNQGLRALYRTRKFVGDKGSLLKALLEQFALLAPKM